MKRLLAMACVMGVIGSARGEVTTGAAAPEFELKDTSGASHKLSDLRGKFVVLEWINHDCPFVLKHYGSGNMQGLQTTYTDKGVVWLAICSTAEGKPGYLSAGEWPAMNEEKGGKASAILLDSEGAAGRLYGAKTTPHMYVINPDGILIYQGAIDDKPSTDADDIPGAKNYVKAALDEAMAGQPVSIGQTKAYGCGVKYK